ncbi:MAG: BlaI/MecI/CopY family transcriptional regulator [Spirochaetales bacterium]|nr:BlaI/MecI/CopY family transcriptional regulator [Spirochaetales bacterium]
MTSIPKISEAEWTVMKALWGENPVTANKLVEIMTKSTTWKPNTTRSLLNRLVKKGVVGFVDIGRVYHYSPLFDESLMVIEESQSLLKKVFGGAAKPLLVALIESEDLSDDDIEEIRRVLDKK